MSDVNAQNEGTAQEDPLAADKAALAAAQQQLADDQAKLDNDKAVLEAAQAKLDADIAALAAHKQQVVEMATAVEPPAGAVVVPAPVQSQIHEHFDAIESIAVRWGGEIGTDLRNLVGRLKALFDNRPTPQGNTQDASGATASSLQPVSNAGEAQATDAQPAGNAAQQ